MHLSVITATCQRPAQLALTLQQFRSQSLGNLQVEQIVVSDGRDDEARFLANRWNARFFELNERCGHAGAFAKDLGIRHAVGEYVCFWDDDNYYEPHALATLYAIAFGSDIGVARTVHRFRKRIGLVTIPRRWTGTFHRGDVDTMCICVKRSLALREPWGDGCSRPGTDFRWLKKLERHQPTVRYAPIVIGHHL
jgi:GT2 family glycosyltransferase